MEETVLQERYPRRVFWSVWSGVIAFLSLLLAFLVFFLFSSIYGTGPIQLFLVVGVGTLVLTFCARFLSFHRIREVLVRNHSVGRKVKSAREELRRAVVMLVATFVLAMSPVLLMVFLSAVEWFSTILGAFFGIGCGEILFLAAIRQWERSNGLTINRYKIYSYDLGRNVLVEYGLRTSSRRRRKK